MLNFRPQHHVEKVLTGGPDTAQSWEQRVGRSVRDEADKPGDVLCRRVGGLILTDVAAGSS